MQSPDTPLERLRKANPVDLTASMGALEASPWRAALRTAILEEQSTDAAATDRGAPRRKRPRAARRRVVISCTVAAVCLTAGGVLAASGVFDGHQEPHEPRGELSNPGDQSAAAQADKGAAIRMLRAGGWSPSVATLAPVIHRELGGEIYTLWTYEGLNGPAALLVLADDRIGGVHTDCSPGEINVCGMASSSEGYVIATGSTEPGAARTEIRRADGTTIDAPTASGYWFARVDFTKTTPPPVEVVSYDVNGARVGTTSAHQIGEEIKLILAGPPALSG